MEVRKGYKQTEVGLIPEDWEVTKLGKHATFKTGPFGSALHQSDYVDDGVPVINPMQIIEGKIQPTSSMTLSEQAARRLTDFKLSTGDIIIGRRGDMGRCAFVQPEQDGWLCGTGSMFIRTNPSLDAGFLQRVLSSPPFIAAIERASVGSTMINLNQDTLRNLTIPFPSTTAEQRAIAAALSDVDALLTALDALIAKKRLIKQGAMQELLTGKKRLPGFSGEWEVKKLGDVVEIQKGELITERIAMPGSIPVIAGGKKPAYFHNSANRSGKTITISGSGANAGYVSIFNLPIFASDCSTISESPDYDVEFIYFALLLNQNTIYKTQTGGAQPHVHPNDLRPIPIYLPATKAEQTAIAAILSDMDAEITALEQRREKTRQLKQGMMQELLTGKTRLV